MYKHMYATYEVTAVNHVTVGTVHSLTYIIEQIWLSHCTYVFHCTATVVQL